MVGCEERGGGKRRPCYTTFSHPEHFQVYFQEIWKIEDRIEERIMFGD